MSSKSLGENYPAGLDASDQLPGLLHGTLRLGKILSHKRFQFVHMPSWYLISGHDMLLYLRCLSGNHKALAPKMRRRSFRSDERLPAAQCWGQLLDRAGRPDRRRLCASRGSPLHVPIEKTRPCRVSPSLVHDQVRQKRREALKMDFMPIDWAQTISLYVLCVLSCFSPV